MKQLLAAVVVVVAEFSVSSVVQAQQNQPLFATGALTPGHAVVLQQTGTPGSAVTRDAGPAIAGNFTEIGITNDGLPLCVRDKASQHIICLGANALGGGLISYNPLGNGTPLGLTISINGVSYPFPGAGNGNAIGPTSPFPTAGDVVCWNGSTNLKDSNCQVNDAAISAAGIPLATFGNSTSITAHTIRTLQTGDDTRDVVQSVINIPAGTTLTGGNAFAGYGQNNASGASTFANPVIYYGMNISNASNNGVWFLNGILGDGLHSGLASGFTGQSLVFAEADFQIDNSTTGVNAFGIQLGSSTAQPASFDGFSITPGSNSVAGVPIHAINSFVSNDGATASNGDALVAGLQGARSGNNILSQTIKFNYTSSVGTESFYREGVNAAQTFYILNSTGSGNAKVDIDGQLLFPQSGSVLFGSDVAINSTGAGALGVCATGTYTSCVLGTGSTVISLNGAVKFSTSTTGAVTPAFTNAPTGCSTVQWIGPFTIGSPLQGNVYLASCHT